MSSFVHRRLEAEVLAATRAFSALVLTGPRRSGKTTLLRRLFPNAQYVLLEDPDVVARVRSDPQGFLDGARTPIILDEIQSVPELFAYVRTRIDRKPKAKGQWLLIGSQEAPLMQNASESMAGRAAVLHLLPLSSRESSKVGAFRGGYPEVIARPRAARLWFASYLQTYLERDVRSVLNVHDLATFRRFIGVLASRHGQVLNKTELAAPLGVSVPTITQWLGVLETTMQIALLPPFYENLGKRLIKAPKLYFVDSGLACHLLGIESEAELRRSPFLGAIFEGFVASELIKAQLERGRRRELYYFRDQQGLEVDFIAPARNGGLALIEAKAGKTVRPAMAEPMQKLARALAQQKPRRDVELTIVHEAPKAGVELTSVAKGVRAEPWQDWAQGL